MHTLKIYIKNIPASYDIIQIKKLFADCGKINEVNYPLDKKSKLPKGYAFVTFEEENAVQNALIMDQKEIEGQLLTVQYAKEKSEKIKAKPEDSEDPKDTSTPTTTSRNKHKNKKNLSTKVKAKPLPWIKNSND